MDTSIERRILIQLGGVAAVAFAANAAQAQPAAPAGPYQIKPCPSIPRASKGCRKKSSSAISGLKREELIAMNSTILHEIYFDSLGRGAAAKSDAYSKGA